MVDGGRGFELWSVWKSGLHVEVLVDSFAREGGEGGRIVGIGIGWGEERERREGQMITLAPKCQPRQKNFQQLKPASASLKSATVS